MKEHNYKSQFLFGSYDELGNLRHMCWESSEIKARARLLHYHPDAALIRRIR